MYIKCQDVQHKISVYDTYFTHFLKSNPGIMYFHLTKVQWLGFKVNPLKVALKMEREREREGRVIDLTRFGSDHNAGQMMR